MAQVWLDKTALSNEMVRLALIDAESVMSAFLSGQFVNDMRTNSNQEKCEEIVTKVYATVYRMVEFFPHSEYVNDRRAKNMYDVAITVKPLYDYFMEVSNEGD